VSIQGVQDNSFNGTFTVAKPPSDATPDTFFYKQDKKPNGYSGGGMAASLQSLNVFRRMENFGHIGPPAQGIGTSDHLPIFFIV
jgi:hypothetical protein